MPELALIGDVALDPYSSDGHDGLVVDGEIVNDDTLPILAAMAVTQAEAGADVVAPSDMMDGRVAAIRQALDAEGHTGVAICSYCINMLQHFMGRFAMRWIRRHEAATRRPIKWTRLIAVKPCAR